MKNTMHGNRVLLKFGGKVVGDGVQSVDPADDFGLQDVDGLGNPEAVELVPGKVVHTITLSKFFVYNKRLIDTGFVPTSEQYLMPPEFEVEILDRVSGETVELYTQCKLASYARSYGKHVISVENATIRSLHKEV